MELKSKMTFDELAEHYSENHSLNPNRVLVGRYARQLGFAKVRQRTHYKIAIYYINEAYRVKKQPSTSDINE